MYRRYDALTPLLRDRSPQRHGQMPVQELPLIHPVVLRGTRRKVPRSTGAQMHN